MTSTRRCPPLEIALDQHHAAAVVGRRDLVVLRRYEIHAHRAELAVHQGIDRGGETYGLALGYRLASFRLELDYTSIDDDVSLFGLGLVYPF